ncbi:MAG TPA: TGS domain-containing protein, partial [Acidimicrobiales bacterium]|nr:TGS domain-containing protein [Acidimicrobiales bacterium]
TTRPVPATTRIGGVLVQLVEIPGLLAGANDDRGGGRALLGVVRAADAIVFCHALDSPRTSLDVIRAEVAAAGIDRPALVAATKSDDAPADALEQLCTTEHLEVVPVSVLDDDSLASLRERMWALTGLVRVHLRRRDDTMADPIALKPPVTVADVAHTIHHEIGDRCSGGRVWGQSVRFDGQRVGRSHLLRDGDHLEVIHARAPAAP